jgi:hypothetical protein
MARITLRWSILSLTVASLVLAVYWLVSITSNAGDFSLRFERRGGRPLVQVVAKRGEVVLCDNPFNAEVIQAVDKSILIGPKVKRDIGWRLPGFTFRYIRFESGFLVWALHLSQLLLLVGTAVVAGFCLRRLKMGPRLNAATSGISS